MTKFDVSEDVCNPELAEVAGSDRPIKVDSDLQPKTITARVPSNDATQLDQFFNKLIVLKNMAVKYLSMAHKALKLPLEEVQEDLTPYRQIALQLIYEQSENHSSILVTPHFSQQVARSSVILAQCIAQIIKSPILLVDISADGTDLPSLLGNLNRAGEEGFIPERNKRFYSVENNWFFNTREGEKMGPFPSLSEAQKGLQEFIATASYLRFQENPARNLDQFAVPTGNKNVSFIPAAENRFGFNQLKNKKNNLDYFSALIEDIRSGYEYVLFYGGTLVDSRLSIELAPYSDLVMLAAVENETNLKEYDTAQDTLQMCQAKKICPILLRATRRKLKLNLFRFKPAK